MEFSTALELVTLAERASEHILGDDAALWTHRLDERADELSRAVETLMDAGEDQGALRLVGALSRYAQASGRMVQIRGLVDQVLASAGARAPHGSPFARASLVKGELAFRQGEQEVAATATKTALAAAELTGDTVTMAWAEMNLARVAFRDGDAPRIFEHAERMRFLARGEASLTAGALHMLGWAEYTAGNLEGAVTRFEENVEAYREIGNRVGMAGELANLGDLALEGNDFLRAAALLRQAIDLAAATRSHYLLPSLLASVAALCGARGRAAEMLELTGAADGQYETAALQPDPGDGVNAAAFTLAVAAVGQERADQLRARGRQLALEDALDLARSSLGRYSG